MVINFGQTPVGSWGPPALNAELLAHYSEQAQKGIGAIGGMLGGAIGGGIKGAQNSSAPAGTVAADQPMGFLAGAASGAMDAASPDDYKKLKDSASAAKYFMKAGGDDAFKKLGLSKDQFDSLSPGDQVSAVGGLLKAQSMSDARNELATRMQVWQAQIDAQKRAAREAEAMQGFAKDYAESATFTQPDLDNVDTSSGRLWNPGVSMTQADRFNYALRKNPMAGASPQLDNLLVALGRVENPKQLNEFSVNELGQPHPVPGMPGKFSVPTSVHGVQIVNDPESATTARPVKGPDGSVKGYMVGDKYMTADDFEGLPANAELDPMKDTAGKVILGMYKTKNGKIIRTPAGNPMMEALQAIMGGTTAAGNALAAPAPSITYARDKNGKAVRVK